MLAIEVEFLTGHYVATRHDDRTQPEWPPHPARLVFALVAAAGKERTPSEEAALEWICEQLPPELVCSDYEARTVAESYVPVNDRVMKQERSVAAAGTLPRDRKARTFPCAVPESPVVTYTWTQAEPDLRTHDALSSLAARLVYLGHSSSLVRVHLVDRMPTPTLVPGREGCLVRVPAPGLIAALDEALARYEATGVRGPLPCDYASYGYPAEEDDDQTPESVFEEMIVLRREAGPRLPLAAAEQVALSLRAALMSQIPNPIPEMICGHHADGSPLQRPHVAFAALPNVGHPHADGALLGVCLVLPHNLEESERDLLMVALGYISQLRISRTVCWSIASPHLNPDRQVSIGLLTETWIGPARRFATVTPIELDHFVDDRLGAEAEELVARSALRAGLPRPVRVNLSPVSSFIGGGHIRDVRRYGSGPRRPLVHAIIDFGVSVRGPVALGSGRYRGLGLCRPLERL